MIVNASVVIIFLKKQQTNKNIKAVFSRNICYHCELIKF